MSSGRRTVGTRTFLGSIKVEISSGGLSLPGSIHLALQGRRLTKAAIEEVTHLLVDGVDELQCTGSDIYVVSCRMPSGLRRAMCELDILASHVITALSLWAEQQVAREGDLIILSQPVPERQAPSTLSWQAPSQVWAAEDAMAVYGD